MVMEEQLFETIMEKHTEKKVVSCCKKLIKKNTLTSWATSETLSDLAYWLYVYGHKEDALKVCEFAHLEEPTPEKLNFNVWTFVLDVWGLEAYILREMGDEKGCQERIAAMDRIWHIPTPTVGDDPLRIDNVERARRDRFDIDFVISKRNMDAAIARNDKTSANGYRFTALKGLIGLGVTGLFPHLENNKTVVDNLIEEYIQILNEKK